MRAASMGSYLALLRVGFTLPRTVTSRAVRSYRTFSPLPNPATLENAFQRLRGLHARFGGIFSAALAVGLRLPGVTWHPALWSPDFPPTPSSSDAKRRMKN